MEQLKAVVDNASESKKDVYNVKINMGIGDVLMARGILDAQKDKFSKVYVSPNYDTFKGTRNATNSDIEFTEELMRMVLKPPYYNLVFENTDYEERYSYTFGKYNKFPTRVTDLSEILCEGVPLDIGTYVVVTTRVRELPKKEYDEQIKDGFLKRLSKISKKYKVVIIGERKISDIPEHKELIEQRERLYSIYDDIIGTLNKNRVVDLSFDNLKERDNDKMKTFKQDCLYMKNAKYTIVLGNGGNACVALYVANVIGYYSLDNIVDPFPQWDDTIYNNIYYNTNLKDFFDNLDKKVYGDIIDKDSYIPNTYKVRINLGIGDILFARSVLDNQKSKYDKVYISPDYTSYNQYRQPSKIETKFTNELLELIFQPPYYHLEKIHIEGYPNRFCQTFSTLDNFPLVVPQLSDVICEGSPLDIGPYITISTRVREVPISEFEEKVKKKFLDKMLEFSETYKIVILGEQKLAEYTEHKILSGRVFTIYKDLIETLPKNRIIDLSFEDPRRIKENRMTRFKQECLYMRDAEWNIVIGNGGNACIAASIGNAIGYFSPTDKEGNYYHRMFTDKQKHTSIYYTCDVKKFIKKLNDVIKPKPTYDICVNMGVGDLLIIRGELDKAKDKFGRINITPNIPFFDRIRSKEYTNGFIKDYIKLLFPPPYYNLTTNLNYPIRDGHGIQIYDGVPIASPHHLRDLFCVGESLDIGPYITINTKVRIVQKSSYNNFKSRFYETLNKISKKYKIVILGDRHLPNWQEFNMFPNDIFTIYDDIVKYIPKERYIDLTFNDLHKGTLQRIQQDCLYMKNAVNNIFLGAAGAWCLGLVSGKSLSYYEPKTNNHWNEYTTIKSNAYLTDNLDKYLYWITQI